MCAEAPTNKEAQSEVDYSSNYAVKAMVDQVNSASFVQNLGNGYWYPAGTLVEMLYEGADGDTSLITSGDKTADVVINETALQTVLDTTVKSITAKVSN